MWRATERAEAGDFRGDGAGPARAHQLRRRRPRPRRPFPPASSCSTGRKPADATVTFGHDGGVFGDVDGRGEVSLEHSSDVGRILGTMSNVFLD